MSRLNTAVRGVIRSRRVQSAAVGSGAAEDFARAYVAGEDIADAVDVARTLTGQGLLVSLAYLPRSDAETETTGMLIDTVAALGETARGVEVSVKPSSLGLRVDAAGARARLEDLCAVTRDAGAVVTLEMQGTEEYDATLRLWRDAREHCDRIGLTLPADIRRSEREAAAAAAEGARVRVCVGSYPVPPGAGYDSEQEKSRALVRCLRTVMEHGGYAMLASHDPTLVAIAQDLARRNAVGADEFEFQMFYGVRPLEQRRLADIGYRSRTYVPFGPAWFEYLTTRIAARPRTLFSYLRAIADKR
ncbi:MULTISPECIES: proline dehydrogenase family protein [Tessaracoccus]|uniref:proline dehydrogenase family protein n=1 Tax=Tessaracoccus TaxID=72763 RepID=UPI0011461DC5|nr:MULTISPECIES: proline dehydrogenase family protein [Tessaracoccus]VEP40985.1 Proline dehydrogenase 1 [Tessaracoccus lapidicaptus]